MRELLEYLTRALVDSPDEVTIEEFEEDDGTLVLELSVGLSVCLSSVLWSVGRSIGQEAAKSRFLFYLGLCMESHRSRGN